MQPRKRCRRYNDSGHAHFVTYSCYRRRPFLTRDRSRLWTRDAIAAACEKHAYDLWAYVIMPEHVHLLVSPRDADYDMSRFLASVKLPVSRRAAAFVERDAPQFKRWMRHRSASGRESLRFWQHGGGFDANLTSPIEVHQTIDYIHANPVRRGLCERAEDWPWSSAAAFAGDKSPIPIAFDSIPAVTPND